MFGYYQSNNGEIELSDDIRLNFTKWCKLNRTDKHFDDYGQLHIMSLQYVFNVMISIINHETQIIYPSLQEAHKDQIKVLLDKEENQYQHIRLALYAKHYEAISNTNYETDVNKSLVKY